jgi:hypothetical protein
MNLTEIEPSSLKEADAQLLAQVLPKLAGLKKIIAVVEARAKELLTEDPEAFDGEWILKEGATNRKVVDVESFVARLLAIRDKNDEPAISASDLLRIATFTLGKVEDLVIRNVGVPKKVASQLLEQQLGDAVATGRNAPTLVKGK